MTEIVPTKAYKHVPLAFAEAFESGQSIRIGTLDAYRKIESDRADRLEGSAEYKIPVVQQGAWNDPALDPVFDRLHLGVPRGAQNVIIRGLTVTNRLGVTYAFCASAQPDFTRIDGGEAIYCISDMERFGRRLARRSDGNLSDTRVAPVQYGVRSTDPFVHGLLDEGPFHKNVDFQWENEVRIAWSTKHDRGDFINLNAPWASDLITRLA